MTTLRPQPRFPEPDTQPFWDATRRQELTYQTCNKCNQVIFYPRRHCTGCGSDDTTWHVSRGEGTVYTFSVVMQSRHPAFKEECCRPCRSPQQGRGPVLQCSRLAMRRPPEREAATGRPCQSPCGRGSKPV